MSVKKKMFFISRHFLFNKIISSRKLIYSRLDIAYRTDWLSSIAIDPKNKRKDIKPDKSFQNS